MKMRRRAILKGLGGASLALPFLDSMRPRGAKAQNDGPAPFAIFFRQANGVASEQMTDEIGAEPEKFWPRDLGTLTPESVQGRALDELTGNLDKVLAVGHVNMHGFDYGDGHARGCLQGMTARGPVVPAAGGDSEANGESLDHRIGAELNEAGRESMFLYAGQNSGWLGGACISYRGPGNRRAPLHNPMNAYQAMMGVDADNFAQIAARQKSVNDLVKGQMDHLLNSSRLGGEDRRRLELHRSAIRDLEESLSCNFTADQERELEGLAAGFESTDGDEVLATARAHMDIAALAVACGYTRSVAIQVGNGNDGNTRYRDPDTGQQMENYHYVSHRRLSHDANGQVIPNSDILHHKIDRQFAQTFNYLLDRLRQHTAANGAPLLDTGLAIWYNDNGNGPQHAPWNIPYIIGGSANGYLKQGEYLHVEANGYDANHSKMLNTIGAAVGLKNANGDPLDDFGDPSMPRGRMPELLA